MWNIFHELLTPPVFEDDDEKTRRAEFLHFASILLFVSNLILFWITLEFGTQAAKSASWILGMIALLQFVIQWMIKIGYVNPASFLLLSIGWVAMTTINRIVGGIHDEATFGYVIILLASGYLVGWKTAIAYTLASIAALWWLASLEINGKLVPVVDDAYHTALDLTVVFILISLVIYFLIKTLTKEIAERKRTQDELQKLAITDPLSGLFNRRHFFEIAEKEFSESVRYDRPLSLIILDLDLFKEINDTYGHHAGDQVLIHIGSLLHNAFREPDTLARYGGEEFVVLLPETDCASAKIVAERLRKLVEEALTQYEGHTIHLTASFGVAEKGDHGEETFDQLVSKADQALYEAKRKGRNQVLCFHEENGKLFS